MAVQAAMAVMMALRYTEAVPKLTTVASHREPQGQRHSGPILTNWYLIGTCTIGTLNS